MGVCWHPRRSNLDGILSCNNYFLGRLKIGYEKSQEKFRKVNSDEGKYDFKRWSRKVIYVTCKIFSSGIREWQGLTLWALIFHTQKKAMNVKSNFSVTLSYHIEFPVSTWIVVIHVWYMFNAKFLINKNNSQQKFLHECLQNEMWAESKCSWNAVSEAIHWRVCCLCLCVSHELVLTLLYKQWSCYSCCNFSVVKYCLEILWSIPGK